MHKDQHVKPCPRCLIEMKIQCSSAKNEHEDSINYYSIYCKRCGYGSAHTYSTLEEAISHWNSETLANYLPPVKTNEGQPNLVY